ncbi:uncharacterized protein [Branchiostoma lanceolatum]|uniref:uncharacterized protein n=1 Tax=Branchiostoma lanceolatum TaxID=7740 RepID=UPI0034523EC3
MALAVLTLTFLAFVYEVAPEHCPSGLGSWSLNSSVAMFAPFDCPKSDDPPGHIYCCGFYAFRLCCPERCEPHSIALSCPKPAPSWPDHDNTGSSSDSGTYDSDDYYDSDDTGFSIGPIALLAVAFLCVVCIVTLCCKNAYNREEDLSRAMGSDGYVAAYVDGTTLSSPGRTRGRVQLQADAVAGTVVHPTVHVHPRSPDQHSNRARAEPPTRGFPPADPPPFAPPPSSAAGFFPSAPPTRDFSSADPPPYQAGTTPPSAAHGQPPFSDEPPPYDIATMFPAVNPQDRALSSTEQSI